MTVMTLAVWVGLANPPAVRAGDANETPPPGPGEQKPSAPAANPAAPKPPEPAAKVLDTREVQGILGRDVRSSAGENMGRVVEVIVDRGGHVRAAVIDFGGFLGVGSRKIAVDWAALHFGGGEKRDPITLELTKSQVREAPEYKDGKPVVVLGAAGSVQPLPGAPE